MGKIKTAAVTTAIGYPISLEEIKDHLAIDRGETMFDDHLKLLLDAAIERVQDYTGRKLLTSVWDSYYDAWPADDNLKLPFAPLQSIASTGVTYTPSTGGTLKFSSTAWQQDTVEIPPRLVLKFDSDWPSEQLGTNNPICVRATYGYTTQSKVPASLKHAMLLMIADWHEHRESIVMGVVPAMIPRYIERMMDNYRVRYLR